jgi:hypothetical protein
VSAFQPGGHEGTCPVCGGPAVQSARYPRALCGPCTSAAVCEDHGRLVVLGASEFQLSGLEPGHMDGTTWTPCPGGERVLVRGVACTLREAYMGGAVAQPVGVTPLPPEPRDRAP